MTLLFIHLIFHALHTVHARNELHVAIPNVYVGALCLCRKMVPRVDEDKDGFVTEAELKDWVSGCFSASC